MDVLSRLGLGCRFIFLNICKSPLLILIMLGALPGQVFAQTCNPNLDVTAVDYPVQPGDTVRVHADIGAETLQPPDTKLMITDFQFGLDCEASELHDNCTLQGNGITFDTTSITTGQYPHPFEDPPGPDEAVCKDSAGNDVIFQVAQDSTYSGVWHFSATSGLPLVFTADSTCAVDFDVIIAPDGPFVDPFLPGNINMALGWGDPNASCDTEPVKTASADATFGVFVFDPGIDIEKATNGEDADNPTGPYIPVGDPVNWTYVVTNTGNVALTNVIVSDDQGVAVSCPQDTLEIAEFMTCSAAGIATPGQYANIGSVTGTPPAGLPNVTDSDPSHYFGSQPIIDIEKATNGEDADTPTGPYIPVGDAVNWTYVVTNTGNVPLTNVIVGDDQGVAVSCPQDTLAVAESMTCTAAGIATPGQYANIGDVAGTPPVGPPVADSDPSHYFGESPAMDIEKSSPTSSLSAPGLVEYVYLVSNIGNVQLTGIQLEDNNDEDDMVCPYDFLAPGASMICTATHDFTQEELDAGRSGTPIPPAVCKGGLYNLVTASSIETADVTDDLCIPIIYEASVPALSTWALLLMVLLMPACAGWYLRLAQQRRFR